MRITTAGATADYLSQGQVGAPVTGTPDVFAKGQGGLMDVALQPDFEQNRLVYLSFAHPGPGGSAATALGRGELGDDQLDNFEVIFTQEPWIDGPNHFGHRNIEAAANQPQAGKNYGWPVVSWGIHYDGTEIPDPPTVKRL